MYLQWFYLLVIFPPNKDWFPNICNFHLQWHLLPSTWSARPHFITAQAASCATLTVCLFTPASVGASTFQDHAMLWLCIRFSSWKANSQILSYTLDLHVNISILKESSFVLSQREAPLWNALSLWPAVWKTQALGLGPWPALGALQLQEKLSSINSRCRKRSLVTELSQRQKSNGAVASRCPSFLLLFLFPAGELRQKGIWSWEKHFRFKRKIAEPRVAYVLCSKAY